MKKSLLITTSLLTLGLVTGIYAQTTGATGTMLDKMKAVAHSFTLSATLNPTDTGLSSDPVKGKKTGDILTAGEWNRMLELVSEGGGGSAGLELWKCTCGGYINMVTTSNLTFGETCVFGNGGTANNVQYSSWSCTKIPNSGNGSGGSGWVDVPLTDTADYDTSCEYRFGINFVVDDINRKWLNATSASGYPMILSTKFLGVGFTGNNLLGIPSSNKSQYGYRDSAGAFTLTTNVSISSVQKRCGGGGSSGGAKPSRASLVRNLGLSLPPPPGMSEWPDSIICTFATGENYIFDFYGLGGGNSLVAYWTQDGIGTYFNKDGTFNTSQSLRGNPKCGSTKTNIKDFCAEGRCLM